MFLLLMYLYNMLFLIYLKVAFWSPKSVLSERFLSDCFSNCQYGNPDGAYVVETFDCITVV